MSPNPGAAALPVVVTGLGVLSPLGDSAEKLHGALCRGERALATVESLPAEELPCRLGAQLAPFDPVAYLGEGNFRPLDRTGLFAVVAAQLALAAAGWEAEARRERLVGLVLGTMYGSAHTISEFDRRALTAGPNYVKPFDFANSVINAAAGQAAIWHGLPGVNATVAGGLAAGLHALSYAADLVATGRSEAVLAGGADELCLESYLGFARAGALCGSNGGGAEPRPVPFDAQRNGLAPAEGAALLVLESEASARRRGRPVLARVLGSGAAFDPSRGRDGASASRAVARAVTAALEAAHLAPAAVDCWSAGADGGVELDAREAAGVAAALGERARELPVTAVKSMLGEALGASGAFQAASLVEILATGRLPGVAGLEATEPGFPLPAVRRECRELTAHRVGLATALDRHGAAQAVLLGGPEAGG